MNTFKKMKTAIILVAVVLAAPVFTSCSNDDDGGGQDPIVGTWLLSSATDETVVDGVSQGVTNDTVDENNFVRVTFNADGTFSEFYSDSFMVNGMLVIETDTENGTYAIDGNMLTITYVYDDGGSDTDDLEFTLDGNQLSIIYTEIDSTNKTTYIYTLTLTRQ